MDHIQPQSQSPTSSPPPPVPNISHVRNPPPIPNLSLVRNHSKSPQTKNKELRVYVKRKRPKREIEHSTPLTHVQESKSSPKPVQIHSGKGTSNLETKNDEELVITDLNMPIALRKGVRTCTQHPSTNLFHMENYLYPTSYLFRLLKVCSSLILFRKLSRI